MDIGSQISAHILFRDSNTRRPFACKFLNVSRFQSMIPGALKHLHDVGGGAALVERSHADCPDGEDKGFAGKPLPLRGEVVDVIASGFCAQCRVADDDGGVAFCEHRFEIRIVREECALAAPKLCEKNLGESHAGARSRIEGDAVNLFDRYFAAQPPFAESSKKKHEFPDAVALLALEHWAGEHDTAVLVVSTDADWQRFCTAHPRLLWPNNLGGALAAFQDERAQFAADRLAETLVEGLDGKLAQALLAAGRSFARQIGVGLDVRSAFDFTWTYDVHVEAIRWPATDGVLDECEAIDHRDGKVVVRVKGALQTKIAVYFTFSAMTGAGNGTVTVGGSTMVFDDEIPCGMLVTVDGDTSHRVTVRDIEFLPTAHRIAVGEITPEWIDPINAIGLPDATFGVGADGN